jgi:EAL domain-containing protein (putative c-di-GMP-specific phosphodiesterase class I)
MVKIDRRLVRLLHTDERRATALLRSVVDVANALDLVAIAAGVETRRHLGIVKSLGFHAAQGFVFGQPMPRHEAVEFLRDAMGRNLIDEL